MRTHAKPLLSVITVCLNARASLEKTIRSIDHQTLKHWEHIVIDGASTDGTLELLKGQTCTQRYFSTQPDSGIYQAMNRGIQMCNGEWILFLNAGDVFIKDTSLEEMFLRSSEFLKSDWFGVSVELDSKRKRIPQTYFFSDGQVQFHLQPGTFYSREFLQRYDGFRESFRISGDYAFGFEHFPASKHRIFSDVVTRMEKGGVSQRPSLLRLKEDLLIRLTLGNHSVLKRLHMLIECLVRSVLEFSSYCVFRFLKS